MTTEHLTMFDPADNRFLKMVQTRFTPCARMGLLLKRTAATAKCASGGGVYLFSRANPGVRHFQDRRRAVLVRLMNKLLWICCEIFRGKMSRPETQPHLNERTQSAPSR
jgi:hypothetical protein